MSNEKNLPWRWSTKQSGYYSGMDDARGYSVFEAEEYAGSAWIEMSGNTAGFIECAVNCHDDLVEALKKVTALYVDLVNSGDAGNWDPEKDAEIIAARAAIAKAGG